MPNLLQSHRPTGRQGAHYLVIALICTLAAVLTAGVSTLDAQQAPPNQSELIAVTVTDPLNRFVIGLAQENFSILENGIPRPIIYFSDQDSPLALAIISEAPLSLRDLLKAQDELIQTSSLSDALGQLVASKSQRKIIIVPAAADVHGVPAGIQVMQTDAVLKAVVELRNQYLLRFRSSDPAARFEVILKPPRGVPLLKANWNSPHA